MTEGREWPVRYKRCAATLGEWTCPSCLSHSAGSPPNCKLFWTCTVLERMGTIIWKFEWEIIQTLQLLTPAFFWIFQMKATLDINGCDFGQMSLLSVVKLEKTVCPACLCWGGGNGWEHTLQTVLRGAQGLLLLSWAHVQMQWSKGRKWWQSSFWDHFHLWSPCTCRIKPWIPTLGLPQARLLDLLLGFPLWFLVPFPRQPWDVDQTISCSLCVTFCGLDQWSEYKLPLDGSVNWPASVPHGREEAAWRAVGACLVQVPQWLTLLLFRSCLRPATLCSVKSG